MRATSRDVRYELEQTETNWRLRVVPDYSWLSDSDRVYPVLVDPSITLPAPSADSWIGEDNPTDNFAGGEYVRVGGQSGQQKRAVIRFALPNLPSDAWVTNAALQLYLDSDHSQAPVAGSSSHGDSSRTGPQPRSAGIEGSLELPDYGRHQGDRWQTSGHPGLSLSGGTSGYKTFDVTPVAAEWVQGGRSNNGIMVRKKANGVNRTVRFYTLNAPASKRPVLSMTFVVGTSEDPCASDHTGPTCGDGVLLSESAEIGYEDLPIDVVPTTFNPDGSVDVDETLADLATLYETDANYQELNQDDVQGALSAAEQMLQDPPPHLWRNSILQALRMKSPIHGVAPTRQRSVGFARRDLVSGLTPPTYTSPQHHHAPVLGSRRAA
ncbi:DNRLRE domain-containing protein [Nocardioides sambongensis]|uniref:DNRLRE domain-containing protein n=1 Tax=Nocardioides sambongensis TaxID=2589074 RepID=UPI0011274FA0|nr:DNRLRE domain-containing protein [Nocardioides sambongensis]